ncbi:MAG: M28 family peptidase [Acidobacteriota bacterium]
MKIPYRAVNKFVQKTFVFSFVVALMLATPAWQRAYAQQATAQKVASGKVSADAITRHVNYLASDKLQGRRAGTPPADEAAKYIANEFKKAGLKPVDGKNYLQDFSFISGVKLGAKNSFEFHAIKMVVASTFTNETPGIVSTKLKVGTDFMPLAFSSSTPVNGQLVFVGYGISAPELQHDDYAGVDVKGKVVAILRGSPDGNNPHGKFAEFTAPGLEVQKKTIKAREKGAAGVIFISETDKFSDDKLSTMRHDLNFLDAGIPVVVVSKQAAESLLGFSIQDATKRANGEKTVEAKQANSVIKTTTVGFQTDVVKLNGKTANVAGLIEGSDPQLKSEYVVIGAHYDHLGLGGGESLEGNPYGKIHHGADDNASGTSALLELARVMMSDKANLKRSVVFLSFSAEELGLLGSAAYTRNPLVPLASTVAMLNMDMVGRLRDRSLFVGGVGTSPTWKPLLDKLNGETVTSASGPNPGNGSGSRFQLGTGQDGFGPSDHQSFYVKDVPVLFFFTGSHDDYHKSTDTAEKINAEGTRQIAEFVREIATTVANEPQRIAFVRVKSEQPNQGRRGGFRVYIGTVPSYAEQNDGLKLDGVRPGSPAEKAGLKAGDVVIKIAQMNIKNVYDYTAVLGELKAGEEIEVVIKRDGQELKVKLTPEKRQ